MVLEDLDSYTQKKNKQNKNKKTRAPTYTIQKNKFQVDKRLKYKL